MFRQQPPSFTPQTYKSCIANCNNNPRYDAMSRCQTTSANPLQETFNENFKGASCIAETMRAKNDCIAKCKN